MGKYYTRVATPVAVLWLCGCACAVAVPCHCQAVVSVHCGGRGVPDYRYLFTPILGY